MWREPRHADQTTTHAAGRTSSPTRAGAHTNNSGRARLAASLGHRPHPPPLPGALAVLSRASAGVGCSVGTPPTHTPQMKAGSISSRPFKAQKVPDLSTCSYHKRERNHPVKPGGTQGSTPAGPQAHGHKGSTARRGHRRAPVAEDTGQVPRRSHSSRRGKCPFRGLSREKEAEDRWEGTCSELGQQGWLPRGRWTEGRRPHPRLPELESAF